MLEYQKKMAALEREKALRDVEAAGKVMKNKLGGHKRNLGLNEESAMCVTAFERHFGCLSLEI